MACRLRVGIALVAFGDTVFGLTPYEAQDGWTYHLEGRRAQVWPLCQYRFLSYPDSCDSIDAWKGTGANQAFTLETAGGGAFHLKTKCGTYLSYPADCASTKVDTWAQAGSNQKFRLSDAGSLGWSIEALGRSGCDDRFVGFPLTCSTSGPDTVLLQTAGAAAGWHGHPASSPLTHSKATFDGCADPFAWRGSDGMYHMACSASNLPLFESTNISHKFTNVGDLLGGSKPGWAQGGKRWAPENVEIGDSLSIATFSDDQAADGKHRVGWVMSETGTSSGAWSTYSPTFLDLGNAPGGEIDQHVFVDDDGASYLVWKTDDNSVGDARTRIWAQPCDLSSNGLALKGYKRVIMESGGLWWVDSWVEGGTLVEGPEIVRRGEYYYLFFASGRYCQDSYSEGVARSKSLMGPYTKLGVPLLSTSMVGTGEGGKVIGPGHASYVKDEAGDWHAVWHASEGEACNRHAYSNKLGWTADEWPYVDFDPSSKLAFMI